MLPKRKMIKKRYIKKEHESLEDEDFKAEYLLEKINGTDPTAKEEALSIIANLMTLPECLTQPIFMKGILDSLLESNIGLVHVGLHAIANMCTIETKLVKRYFQMGLQKNLMGLHKNSVILIESIIILMLSIIDEMDERYRYLLLGIEQILTRQNIDEYSEIILQFLYKIQSRKLNNQIIDKIIQVYENQQHYKIKSLCVCVLLNYQKKEGVRDIVREYFQELLINLDLEAEYELNFKNNKFQQVNKNNKIQDIQQEQINSLPLIQYEIFTDAVQGIQLLLERILNEIDDNQYQDIDIQIRQQQTNISQQFKQFIIKNIKKIIKNILLQFPTSLNIIQLTLRILFNLEYNIQIQYIIINQFITFINHINNFIFSNQISILLSLYLHLFLKYHIQNINKNYLLFIAQKILLINQDNKQCWICLLQIFSNNFNPQKNLVNQQQNQRLGIILSNLLNNIPFSQLEQWRCQTIDTIFDVYSNEQFDEYFIQLGFLPMLQFISESSHKTNKPFIRDVLKDLKRFIEYKKKMLK